jgi:hypothetical protein
MSICSTTRSTTVAAAAATLMVLATGCGQETAAPAASAPTVETAPSSTSSPSPTTSPTPTAAGPAEEVILDRSLPRGMAPQVAYLEGRTVHLADGTNRPAFEDYDRLAVVGDTIVGTWSNERGRTFVDLSAEYDDVSRQPLGNGFAVSPTSETVAWGAPDGTIQSAWDGGQVEMARDIGAATVMAVSGAGTCYEAESTTGGCVVYYTAPNETARYTSSHGIDDIVAPNALDVADVASSGDVAIATAFTDEGSCYAVRRADSWKTRWESCDYTPLVFSPDADHLMATGPYLDGLGFSRLQLLDAGTGEEVASFRTPDGYIAGWTWEDDDHAILSVYDSQGWRLIRIGLDGTAETALVWDGEPRTEAEPPWTLATRPS